MYILVIEVHYGIEWVHLIISTMVLDTTTNIALKVHNIKVPFQTQQFILSYCSFVYFYWWSKMHVTVNIVSKMLVTLTNNYPHFNGKRLKRCYSKKILRELKSNFSPWALAQVRTHMTLCPQHGESRPSWKHKSSWNNVHNPHRFLYDHSLFTIQQREFGVPLTCKLWS